jgi:GR25 family glycosyltransferase involved in LPS biosynthesis
MTPVEAQQLNCSLVESREYDAIISALISGQPFVNWIDAPLYLKDELDSTNPEFNQKVQTIWSRIVTYVIVLTRDPKRLSHVRSKIVPRVKDLNIFSAIDGEDLNQIKKIRCDRVVIDRKKSLRAGQVGCALSHYSVWKQFLAGESVSESENRITDEFCVVLEDDCFLVPDYDRELQLILKDLPCDFDWCYLFVFPKHYRGQDPAVQIAGKNHITKAYFTYSTVAYIISRRGASKLVKNQLLIDAPIDTIIANKIQTKQLNAYASKKIIVKNMGQDTSSPDDKLPSNIWNSAIF